MKYRSSFNLRFSKQHFHIFYILLYDILKFATTKKWVILKWYCPWHHISLLANPISQMIKKKRGIGTRSEMWSNTESLLITGAAERINNFTSCSALFHRMHLSASPPRNPDGPDRQKLPTCWRAEHKVNTCRLLFTFRLPFSPTQDTINALSNWKGWEVKTFHILIETR